jgi:hypothetical protein
MKTNKKENKMKTLNKKNLGRINYLLLQIKSDLRQSDFEGKDGADFWFAIACGYEADLNIIKLYEEFGISAQHEQIIEDDISKKSKLEEYKKNAWDRFHDLSRKVTA